MSGKSKDIPIPCKMFLRFLKERELFHEWRMEGDERIRRDSFIRSNLKFYSIADMWQWYVSRSGTMRSTISDNPIYNVIDQTLNWSRTKRGFSFWSNLHDYWTHIYSIYHKAREIDAVTCIKPMADDLDAFRTVMNEFAKDYFYYT